MSDVKCVRDTGDEDDGGVDGRVHRRFDSTDGEVRRVWGADVREPSSSVTQDDCG